MIITFHIVERNQCLDKVSKDCVCDSDQKLAVRFEKLDICTAVNSQINAGEAELPRLKWATLDT